MTFIDCWLVFSWILHFTNFVQGYAISRRMASWNTETCIFICLIITFINRNIKLHSNHNTQFIVHVLDTWIWSTFNCGRLYIFKTDASKLSLKEMHQFLMTEQILQNITHVCLYQWYSPHIQVIPMCPFSFGAINHNQIAGIERFWKDERTLFVSKITINNIRMINWNTSMTFFKAIKF